MTVVPYAIGCVVFFVVAAVVTLEELRIRELQKQLAGAKTVSSIYRESRDVVSADLKQRQEAWTSDMQELQQALERVHLHAETLPMDERIALAAAIRGFDIVDGKHIPWAPPTPEAS